MKIQYTIEALPEETEIRGNLVASGDNEADKRDEDRVIGKLDNGNQWAWCTVKVTASLPGIELEGTDYLGCCSYTSERSFKRGGYWTDMKQRAKEELLAKIKAVKEVT